MKTFLVVSQYKENYGTPESPYWKFKGGDEFIVTAQDQSTACDLVEPHMYDNDYAQNYIIGCEEVAPDYVTDFEKSQLEYEGEIRYPAKRLGVA